MKNKEKDFAVKIGILGGTFDPCHKGHVNLAKDALEQAQLDEVILMPAKIQPFKQDKKVTSSFHRVNMLNIAIEKIEGLRVSHWELEQDHVSYTYRTLEEVKKLKGDNAKVYFITGTDAFIGMKSWVNSESLLKNNNFIVGVRPGYRLEELAAAIKDVRENYGSEVIKIDNKKFHISSTEIRDRIVHNQSAHDLIDEGVERYILENELYK